MLGQVVVTEFIKLRRTRITWLTLVAFSIAPAAAGLFMWIVREPGRAAQLGLLGTKANLAGLQATWPYFLMMMTLVVGAGGLIILALIASYVFGREYSEGTAKNMLALPVGRHWFVVGKLVVTAAWWAILVVTVLAEALAIGFALGLPGFSTALLAASARDIALVAAFTFLLTPVVAWIATLGRGYLPPIGFAIVMLAFGDVFAHTGWAMWFPWSVVPLFAGTTGPRATSLPFSSYLVVVLTFVVGVAATIAQLRWGDETQ
jgi:ABC-type transport system involved in multi-copper enzyme maturation permease subunit